MGGYKKCLPSLSLDQKFGNLTAIIPVWTIRDDGSRYTRVLCDCGAIRPVQVGPRQLLMAEQGNFRCRQCWRSRRPYVVWLDPGEVKIGKLIKDMKRYYQIDAIINQTSNTLIAARSKAIAIAVNRMFDTTGIIGDAIIQHSA